MEIDFLENGSVIRAVATLPDGRKVIEDLDLDAFDDDRDTLAGCDDDDELIELGFNLKKAFKKAVKVVKAPLKLAHKITHSGPIEALHQKVQKGVAKALPFTKPFIDIHNKLAKGTHKALGLKAVKQEKSKLTAKAIADVTKGLKPEQAKIAQQALALRAKADEIKRDLAKKALTVKVAKAAKKPAPKPAAKKPTAKPARANAKPPAGPVAAIKPAAKPESRDYFLVEMTDGTKVKVPLARMRALAA